MFQEKLKSGLARAIASYLQNIDFSTPKIDNHKIMPDRVQDTVGKVFRGQLQRIEHLLGHQVHFSLI